MQSAASTSATVRSRLPFFYGWVIVAVAFVTMGVGVNVRTAYSLLLPPIVAEFGWTRAVTAGAFSFGFLVTAVASPLLGRLMDRRGPRVVMELGVAIVASGLLLASVIREPWQLYATLGVLVGGGSISLTYTGQGLYLPNWFERRRGLALNLAFSGVGVGSIVLLPFVQRLIEREGWRAACVWMGVLALVLLAPLNLLVRKRPEDLGLLPDGDRAGDTTAAASRPQVVDPVWVAVEWTVARSLRTARFWWVAIGYGAGLYVWYAVQVHQTKYLLEIGFTPSQAASSLGLVSLVAVPGQIVLGHLSDRIGREWIWTVGNVGFALCCLSLLLLRHAPTMTLLAFMVGVQGLLGYGLVSVIGAIPADIFQGRHYGSIFGSLMVASIAGGAIGPWATGALYDVTGSYAPGFVVAMALSVLSAASIWLAAPRKVRAVGGARPRPA